MIEHKEEVALVRYPRNIGIATPSGDQIYELFVSGKDKVGVLKDLSSSIANHEINITSSGRYEVYPSGDFVFTAFLDFEAASVEAI